MVCRSSTQPVTCFLAISRTLWQIFVDFPLFKSMRLDTFGGRHTVMVFRVRKKINAENPSVIDSVVDAS